MIFDSLQVDDEVCFHAVMSRSADMRKCVDLNHERGRQDCVIEYIQTE